MTRGGYIKTSAELQKVDKQTIDNAPETDRQIKKKEKVEGLTTVANEML